MLNLHKIWVEQCEAARGIESEFGTVPAVKYLVGEKFVSYLDAAERNADFRAEFPAFVAKIKKTFEPWQIAQYLEKPGWTEPFDPSLYNDKPGLVASSAPLAGSTFLTTRARRHK